MIYRQATGETIPTTASVLGSMITGAAFGGPLGVVGTIGMSFLQEVLMLKPDTTRAAVPEGMDVTGSEAAMRSVTPGSITDPKAYTTLATVNPDFLGGAAGATQFASADCPSSPDDTAQAAARPVQMALNAYAGTMMGNG